MATNDEIFENIMTALQPAEELGGPGGAQYVALMERIAHEAQGRANRARADLMCMHDAGPGCACRSCQPQHGCACPNCSGGAS